MDEVSIIGIDLAKRSFQPVTCAIMCQWGMGYSLWLCDIHEQEHPDATAYCDD